MDHGWIKRMKRRVLTVGTTVETCHVSVVSKGQGLQKITVRRSWHTVRHVYVVTTLSAKAKNNRGDLDQER